MEFTEPYPANDVERIDAELHARFGKSFREIIVRKVLRLVEGETEARVRLLECQERSKWERDLWREHFRKYRDCKFFDEGQLEDAVCGPDRHVVMVWERNSWSRGWSVSLGRGDLPTTWHVGDVNYELEENTKNGFIRSHGQVCPRLYSPHMRGCFSGTG